MSTKEDKKNTPTHVRLKKWIVQEGYRVEGISNRLGFTKQVLYKLIDGSRMPSLEVAFKLEKFTKGAIRAKDWIKEEDDVLMKEKDEAHKPDKGNESNEP